MSRTDLNTSEQQKLAGVMRSCFEAATPHHRRREASRIFSKRKEALFLNPKEKQRKCEGVNLKGQGGSESDGSLRLPLSSCRTNYQVMDSRLITGATSGFKLAGRRCRIWSDGDGQEGEEGGGGRREVKEGGRG